MKKGNLELLFTVLENVKLPLAEARVRDAFLRKAMPDLVAFHEDRLKIATKFCKKDKNKEPIMNENGDYLFEGDSIKKFDKEYNILAAETIELILTKDIVKFMEKTTYEPKPGETHFIDDMIENCTEAPKEKKKKK